MVEAYVFAVSCVVNGSISVVYRASLSRARESCENRNLTEEAWAMPLLLSSSAR